MKALRRRWAVVVGIALLKVAPARPETAVTVRASRDFGSPPLLQKQVKTAGRTVMDALKACADVETVCGGGFVTAINGVKAGDGKEWFYYVNGCMADRGALQHTVSGGDHIWWDLHAWQGAGSGTALIGCYPHPFPDSPAGGLIFYGSGAREKAEALRSSFSRHGIKVETPAPLDEASARRGGIKLFIAAWQELREIPPIKTLIGHGSGCGPYLRFEAGGLRTLNAEGDGQFLLPRAGAILALKPMFSTEPEFWLITGTDTSATLMAADVLIGAPEKIEGMAGAVVTDAGIQPVPVCASPMKREASRAR
jgi:hypothetical protein